MYCLIDFCVNGSKNLVHFRTSKTKEDLKDDDMEHEMEYRLKCWNDAGSEFDIFVLGSRI
jgi:hypothetical protein